MKDYTNKAKLDYLEECSQVIWKKIPNYENYSVSNMGDVRNDVSGRLLSPRPNGHGYYVVYLCKPTDRPKYHNFYIHRLVGQAFVENPNNYVELDHCNRLRDDNRATNLRWVSHQENLRNKSSNKKINQYDLDGNFIKSYNSIVEAVECNKFEYHSGSSCICSCCKGKCNSYKGYKWGYANEISDLQEKYPNMIFKASEYITSKELN